MGNLTEDAASGETELDTPALEEPSHYCRGGFTAAPTKIQKDSFYTLNYCKGRT